MTYACPDCKDTGIYVGLNEQSPCRSCVDVSPARELNMPPPLDVTFPQPKFPTSKARQLTIGDHIYEGKSPLYPSLLCPGCTYLGRYAVCGMTYDLRICGLEKGGSPLVAYENGGASHPGSTCLVSNIGDPGVDLKLKLAVHRAKSGGLI